MRTLESTIHLFELLNDADKARVLAQSAHWLTIAARWVSTDGTPEQQRGALIALNEIQHTALAQMLAYLDGRTERYADRELFLILVGQAKKSGLLEHLQQAVEKSLSGFNRD